MADVLLRPVSSAEEYVFIRITVLCKLVGQFYFFLTITVIHYQSVAWIIVA